MYNLNDLMYYALCFVPFIVAAISLDFTRTRNEIFVPSLIKFEVKGKSLAWIPFKLPVLQDQVDERHLRRRYIEGAGAHINSSDGSIEPQIIYDAAEDSDEEDYTVRTTEVVTSATTKEEEEECTFFKKGFKRTLPSIETAPYPFKPPDLIFPTCDCDNCSLIEPPKFTTTKCSNTKNASKNKINFPNNEIYTSTPIGAAMGIQSVNSTGINLEKGTQNRESQLLQTTPFKHRAVSTCATKFYQNTFKTGTQGIQSSTEHLPLNDTKVIIRIPPRLADLPIVILRDPKSESLSLTLMNGSLDAQQKTTNAMVTQESQGSLLQPHLLLQPQLPPLKNMFPPMYSAMYGQDAKLDKFTSLYPGVMYPILPPPVYKRPTFGRDSAPMQNYMNQFIRWARSLEEKNNATAQKENKYNLIY